MIADFMAQICWGYTKTEICQYDAIAVTSARRSGKSHFLMEKGVIEYINAVIQSQTRLYPWYLFWKKETVLSDPYDIVFVLPTERSARETMRTMSELLDTLGYEHQMYPNGRSIVSGNQQITITFESLYGFINLRKVMRRCNILLIDEPDCISPADATKFTDTLQYVVIKYKPNLLVMGTDEDREVWDLISNVVKNSYKRYLILSLKSVISGD